MENQEAKNPGLTTDDQQVFDLLAMARHDYEHYLQSQESYAQSGYQFPMEEDYSWGKPLTVVLNQ